MFDYWTFGAYSASNSSVIFPLLSMVLFAVLVLSAMGIFFFKPRVDRPEGMLGFFQAIFASGLSSPRTGLVVVAMITLLVLNANVYLIFKAKVTPVVYPDFASQVQSYCTPRAGTTSIWDFMWGPGKSVTDVVTEGFSNALHNCTDCYAIVLDFPLDMVFIVATLCWIGLKWRRDPSVRISVGPTRVMIFVAFLVGLFVYELLNMQTIFSVWEDMISHRSYSDFDSIMRMLLSAAGFFLGVPMVSVFLAIVYRAAEKLSDGPKVSSPSGELGIIDLAGIIRFTSPSIAFMAIIQIAAKITLNIVFDLTYSSGAWPLGAADIILNCCSWFLFPLPFLALRNRAGLVPSLILFKETWKRRFPYLAVLIFITVAADLLAQGVTILFSYLNALRSPPTVEECVHGILGPNPFRLSAIAVNIVISVLTFVILIRAFQSGYLDVERDLKEEASL